MRCRRMRRWSRNIEGILEDGGLSFSICVVMPVTAVARGGTSPPKLKRCKHNESNIHNESNKHNEKHTQMLYGIFQAGRNAEEELLAGVHDDSPR